MSRQIPLKRSDFFFFAQMHTRWSDNDVYGHLNNTVHYKFFDSALNVWLIENQLVDPVRSSVITLVVDTGCAYFAELAFPQIVTVGMRVERIGRTSITYKFGLFGMGDLAAAQGHLTHVLVDRASRHPSAIPESWRPALQSIQRSEIYSGMRAMAPQKNQTKTSDELPTKETEL